MFLLLKHAVKNLKDYLLAKKVEELLLKLVYVYFGGLIISMSVSYFGYNPNINLLSFFITNAVILLFLIQSAWTDYRRELKNN